MPDSLPPPMPSAAARTPDAAGVGQQAIKEAVEQLRATLPKLQETSPGFANGLRDFLQRGDDPVRLNQAEFQHRVAYAVQDVERQSGQMVFSSKGHRDYLENLSASAPGLRNERVTVMLEGLQQTQDAGLRSEIRRAAIEIGKQADQDTPQIRSQVEVLENRVRLSAKTQSAPVASEDAANRPPPSAAGLDAAGRVNDPTKAASLDIGGEKPSTRRDEANFRRPENVIQAEVQGSAGFGTVLAGAMLRGFEKLGQSIPPAPWETMTTNFSDRLKTFEARQQTNADHGAIQGLEQSGRAAISALQSFSNHEGAVMMNRINQAARSDPNGMDGVMAEMRPGGKYAALRQQFNTAINDEKGFGAAYDKALEAVGQYGMERAGTKTIVARSPDSVAVTTKLEAIEQNIGERIAGMPSKADGKAMMDDLRQQAAEIFKAVAEGLKNLFQRATSGASPSPGA